MRKRIRVIVITLLVMMLCFTGCSKSYKKASSEVKMDAGDGFNIETSYSENTVAEPAAKENMDQNGSGNTNGNNTKVEENVDAKDVNEHQKLIRTVYMGIETEYFDDTVSELDSLCEQFNGYVGSSQLNNQVSNRSYSIEMRIPQENLDQFMDYVSNMGRMQIRFKNENTEDITLDYYDSVEHKKSLEVERDRILELIAEADSLEYVVSLEEKLSELRYQISSYESQLRRMDNKVSYSTVNIDINEVKQITVENDATVGERVASGLKRNLNGLKDFFINLSVWFITSLPNLIVFGGVIFIVVKIGRKLYLKLNSKYTEDNKDDHK